MSRLPLLFWLLLLSGSAAIVATAPPAQDDLSQFLPGAVTREQRLLLDEIRQGHGTRLIMLELSGAPTALLSQASSSLANALRRSGYFEQVLNGVASMGDSLSAPLFEHRYLLAPVTPDSFSAEGLKRALSARLRELGSPVGMPDKHLLPADPTASFRTLLDRWRRNGAPVQRDGVWFSRDGSSALLMLHSRYPAFDLEGQQQAVSAIRRPVACTSQ